MTALIVIALLQCVFAFLLLGILRQNKAILQEMRDTALQMEYQTARVAKELASARSLLE